MEGETEVTLAATAVTNGVKQILTSLQESLSISTVVEVVGICAGASAAFFLLYWGGRKVVGAIASALKRGRLKAF